MKNKTIIVLQGIADSGKTKTLKLLQEKLEEKGVEFITVAEEQRENKEKDVCVKAKDLSIGICTRGDCEEGLDEWIPKIKDCKIIVAPCRSRGKTYQYFEKLKEDNSVYYHTRWGIWYFENGCKYTDKEKLCMYNKAQARCLARFVRGLV